MINKGVLRKVLSGIVCLTSVVTLLSGVPARETVQAATKTVYENESNNNKNEANVIKAGETMVGEVSSPSSDEDWYEFTVPKNGYFTINIVGQTDVNNDFTLYIYDEILNELEHWGGENIITRRLNFEKGTKLFIRVKAYWSNATVDYGLTISFTENNKWETENNDSKNGAEKLTEKMYGTIWNDKDVDWYKYTAPESGVLAFDFINEDAVVTSSGWKIKVYDKSLTEIRSEGVTTDYELGHYTVKAKDVLYISVSGSNMVDNLYSIKPKLKKTKNIEKENNDSFGKANSMKLATPMTGCFNTSDDTDYFKFKSNYSGNCKLSFNMEGGYVLQYGVDIVIYDGSKKEIARISDGKEIASKKFKVKKGKTYYIQVVDHYDSSWSNPKSYCFVYKLKLTKK